MRCIAILVVILFFASPADSGAHSYTCADRDLNISDQIEKKLFESDAVFLGTVVSAKFPPQSEPDFVDDPAPAGIIEGTLDLEKRYLRSMGHLYQQVSFSVTKYWKGEDRKTVDTKVHPARGLGAAPPLKEGEIYLVFARGADNGVLAITRLCGLAVKVDDASERISILNYLTTTKEVS